MLATLKFLADIPLYGEEKPYTLYGFPPDVIPTTNVQTEIHDDIPVSDVRGNETEFRLSQCGFEFHTHKSQCDLRSSIFESAAERTAIRKYLSETITLVEECLHASKAVCFDWRLRRTGGTSDVEEQLVDIENARHKALAPAALMHCDFSYTGGYQTCQIHLTAEEFADIEEGRLEAKIVKYDYYTDAATMNVAMNVANQRNSAWRPLGTVQHSSLILCDRRTVHPANILEVDQVAPTKVELSMSLQYKVDQKYYWLSKQKPEEVILFTCWESNSEDHTTGYTPHGADMKLPTNGNLNARESVEVRLIVLWPART